MQLWLRRSWGNMAKPSYLWKLFAFGVCLGTLPVLILGFFAYIKASDIIQNKVSDGNQHILQQVQINVEQAQKNVDFALTQFSDSPSLVKSLHIPVDVKNYEHVTMINGLMSDMTRLQRLGTNLFDIRLISLDQKWSIGNKGFRLFDQEEATGLQRSAEKNRSRWSVADPAANSGGQQANVSTSSRVFPLRQPYRRVSLKWRS